MASDVGLFFITNARPRESDHDDDVAWLRRHFIDYMRAGGPLPALRIGKQPYGILPVTSLDAWKPPPRQDGLFRRDAILRDFLLRLRNFWRRNVPVVPLLGRSGNIDTDIAEMLSMDALSSAYSIRHLMGRHYLEHLWVFLSAEFFFNLRISWQPQPRGPLTLNQFRDWFAKQEGLTGSILQSLGINWRPRLARSLFSPLTAKLDGPLVQAQKSPNLNPNYIEALLVNGDPQTLRQDDGPTASKTLLYLLLRHSLLLEHVAAASRLAVKYGRMHNGQRYEPELVNFDGHPVLSLWNQYELGRDLLALTPSGEPDVEKEPDLKDLSDFRASLRHLKSLITDSLEQLSSSTLDLCSHRLDAWITSIATKRLAHMRNNSPTGLTLGGYGWVVNLKPAFTQTPATTPAGERGPVFEAAGNPGFIHTPSLTQAATVAVLRSGHLSHLDDQPADSPLAIDLSSRRVRLATWLLDGVRQGQPLGALLGYRFERRLQESGQAIFIAYFRDLAPLVARKLEQTDLPVEAIAANTVVYGLELHRLWRAALDVFKSPILTLLTPMEILFKNLAKKPSKAELDAAKMPLETALNALADAIDAVSDALMAETVHQAVRGNPLRAAGTVDAIAGGETPPPELDVVRTPRTGMALTHRLLTLFSGDPQLPAPWASAAHLPRAKAEPHLNAWAAKLLGDPARLRCTIELVDPATGTVADSKEFSFDQLMPIAPLDFIYALEGGPGGQQAEIEQRILYAMKRHSGGFPSDSLLRIQTARGPEWPIGDLSYGEFSEYLRTLRKLVGGVRGIDHDDLSLPERNVPFGVDVNELENRADAAERQLSQTAKDLATILNEPESADLDALRSLMLSTSGFGTTGAVPLSVAGSTTADRNSLLTQAHSLANELSRRIEELTELNKGFGPETALPENRYERAVARLRAVFGKAFVVLPRFAAPHADELSQALANSTNLQDGDPLAAMTWFRRMARVRDGVARLNGVLTYAEAVESAENLAFTIAQLPHDADDRWVGLPLKNGTTLPGGKLSLVVQSTSAIDVQQPLAGLLIDEWVEVVPNATETTGITFQYDQPNAAPPQTILLAVPPDLEAPWTLWSLQQILLETLDLARIRAVDPDALDALGHYLPALYFAYNAADDTVSTDFTHIK